MTRFRVLMLGMLATVLACSPVEDRSSRDLYPDLIDYRYTPQGVRGSSVCMADMGAWHGLCIPDVMDTIVGATGPYLLGEFCWLAQYLNSFGLADSLHRPIVAGSIKTSSYPGVLRTVARLTDCNVEHQTLYVSNRSSLSVTRIKNTFNCKISIKPCWSGRLFLPFKANQTSNGVGIKTRGGVVDVRFQNMDQLNFVQQNDTSYLIIYANPVCVEPGECITLSSVVTYRPYHETVANDSNVVADALCNPLKYVEQNQARWNGYLKTAIRTDVDKRFDYVPVKAIQTLMTNWKSAIGALKHDGVVPSMSVSYFYGFWAWDSWKHAVALKNIAPELAKEQIRAMFDYQDSAGMVADCVYPDSSENNWLDTKPPLAAWAVSEVFNATADTAFLLEVLPKLEKYHGWWYACRDANANGLCEYGSTDGTLIAAKWESGMDNAVRFDSTQIIRGPNGGWSMNQESVDLNAYLCLEKAYLSQLNIAVGNAAVGEKYLDDAIALKTMINTVFYDSESGYYYDKQLNSSVLLKTAGPEGWTPLWCKIATDDIANRVAGVMLDTTRFNTYVPFPTLEVRHPKFNPDGYWRGPVWLDQVYFAISALRRYGHVKQADELSVKVFNNLEGFSGNGAIHENYDPLTGKALSAPNFSWSAAHLLMIYNELSMPAR